MAVIRRRPVPLIDEDEKNHKKQRSEVDVEEEAIPDNDSDGELVEHHQPIPVSPLPAALLDLPDDLITRIASARQYQDPSHGVYYVTHVPDNLKFGGEHMFDMSNFLVRPDNYAVVVWIIGKVFTPHFVEEDGSWPAQPFISFTPIFREDLRAATKVCNIYAKPKEVDVEINPFGTIYAGRFQKRYKSEKPPSEFRGVYDATSSMKKKAEMKLYDARKVKRDDIVLVELRVKKRFDPDDNDVDKKDRPYRISFQLDALNVLYVAPDRDEGVVYGF
ncbi:hypothetical protein CALCODRAFT_482808 [Calocera cornea HHB12733]|uniref:Uncharacterized protein n=1 Tax=Calocera cornea HHB12733 TaxID=1353952 RepID=A0A165GA64_9BASI|nr:hypothetical protein CALCODRAFT_482808 [Calocera cornea HHB12733]